MFYKLLPEILFIMFCLGMLKLLEWSKAEKGEFSLFKSNHEKVVNSPLFVPYMLSLFSMAGAFGSCAIKLVKMNGWL